MAKTAETQQPGDDGAAGAAAGSDSEPVLAFIGGVLAGVALLGVVWMMASLLGSGSDEALDTSSGASTGGTPGAARSPSSVVEPALAGRAQPDPLERCVAAAGALDAPLRAVVPTMDQWEIHIGAMNKLVVGAITLQQASDFWNQTRVGAERKIDHFDRAVRVLQRQGVDCPSPGLLPRNASPALRTCVVQVTADLHTLETARTAVNTWEMHVHDMERLRLGKLSPADATRMWLATWQRGADELGDYRQAARDSDRAGGCSATAAPATSASASPSAGMDMH